MKIYDLMKEPEMKYRPLNYWGWLENITPGEVQIQVQSMHDAGIGGYVMHARGGLEIPYMGRQWRDSVAAMVEKGKELGMMTIVDDEDGWPSGFGAGAVNGLGPKYQLKWLECKRLEDPSEFVHVEGTLGLYEIDNGKSRRISDSGTAAAEGKYWLHIYYVINKYYVDNIDPEVVAEFIKASYEEYYKDFGDEFGKGIAAIFSDEPQIARYSVHWSFTLPDEIRKRYGYDIIDVLPALFADVEGCETVRYQFWNTVSGLFNESYARQIGEWCVDHNIIFTGHSTGEDNFESMILCCGDTMPYYSYMQLPGIDFLTRRPVISNVVKQVTSVSQQLKKERVMCEMFGCAGWNVAMDELKWMAEWHYVLGIDMMVQHLGLYSLKGSRKREYPAALFFQQPWWDDFKPFNDYFARLGKAIAESRLETELLMLFTIKTGYTAFSGSDRKAVRDTYTAFRETSSILLRTNHDYHYGDEEIMKEYASLEGATIRIGDYRYKCVVIPDCATLDRVTLEMLNSFAAAGGKMVSTGRLPHLVDGAEPGQYAEALAILKSNCAMVENTMEGLGQADRLLPERPVITGIPDILCCTRIFEDGTRMHYMVNTSIENTHIFKAEIAGTSMLVRFNPADGEAAPFNADADITLGPIESLVLFTDKDAKPAPKVKKYAEVSRINVAGEWEITGSDLNILVLDRCEYRIDDDDWQPLATMMTLQKKLIAIGHPVDVELKYSVETDLPSFESMQLVIEEPEKFKIAINGRDFPFTDLGRWVDNPFRKADVSDYIRKGINEIVLKRNFWCSEKVYRIKNDHTVHEAEANRTCAETELEAIYLLGRFDVRTSAAAEYTDRRAEFIRAPFKMTPARSAIMIDDFTANGRPFFEGTIKVANDVEIKTGGYEKVELRCSRPDSIITKVNVNGSPAVNFLWGPYVADITALVKDGNNRIELEMTNSLRNVFGPFRHRNGELYGVGQGNFLTEVDDINRYCVLRFGIENGVDIVLYK